MGFPPKSSIFIGFSIIFTIHFGVPIFLETLIETIFICHEGILAIRVFCRSSYSKSPLKLEVYHPIYKVNPQEIVVNGVVTPINGLKIGVTGVISPL